MEYLDQLKELNIYPNSAQYFDSLPQPSQVRGVSEEYMGINGLAPQVYNNTFLLGNHAITPNAFTQFASLVGIPAKTLAMLLLENRSYTTRILEERLARKNGQQRLRISSDKVIALVSDRYQAFDNKDVIIALSSFGNRFVTQHIRSTDDKLSVELVSHEAKMRILGELVRYGYRITDSQTGIGSLIFEAFFDVCKCTNGAIVRTKETFFRVVHVGRSMSKFIGAIEQMSAAMEELPRYLEAACENASIALPDIDKRFLLPAVTDYLKVNLTKEEYDKVITSKAKTPWDFANDITFLGNRTSGNLHRRQDLSEIGGSIITLKPTEWQTISTHALEIKEGIIN